ncbi:kinase-like domain-containing protein [Mycena sanguinolenta]|nr:kinase-like domain-containing protein [Mycena sanguinolenta]
MATTSTRPFLTSMTSVAALPHSDLSLGERWWYNHRDWLKDCGYLLRPRYQEGWAPPWKPGEALAHEEFQKWTHPVMDATVIADGSFVMLKRIQLGAPSEELDIATWFSAKPQRSDPANHCVPVLRVLSDPKEPHWALIVMPLLRKFDKPRFDTIGEAVGFFKQIFEGVKFMHKHNIAHRDCGSPNIMMDSASLYRIPFHPIKQNRKRDFSGKAHPSLTRTQQPVKYYLTDFGLSRRYRPEERPPLEPTVRGADKTAPEMVHDACDPFPTDVYYLGNLIKTEFLEGNRWTSQKLGFEFMRSLVTDMTLHDPSQRPNMDEVVWRFDEIIRSLRSWKLRSRVAKRADIFGFYYSISHWLRRINFIVRRVPPIPVPSS